MKTMNDWAYELEEYPVDMFVGKADATDAVTSVVVPDMDLDRLDFARNQLKNYPNNGGSQCHCENMDECSQPMIKSIDYK